MRCPTLLAAGDQGEASAFGVLEQRPPAERLRTRLPDGRVLFVEPAVGGGRLLLSEETPTLGALAPPTIGGSPVLLLLEVDDPDVTARQAVEAGAEIEMPVREMFLGERYGVVCDPFGHRWALLLELTHGPGQGRLIGKSLLAYLWSVSDIYKALAHPARRAILDEVSERDGQRCSSSAPGSRPSTGWAPRDRPSPSTSTSWRGRAWSGPGDRAGTSSTIATPRRWRPSSSGGGQPAEGAADEDLPHLGAGGQPGQGAGVLHRGARVREEERHPARRGALAHRRLPRQPAGPGAAAGARRPPGRPAVQGGQVASEVADLVDRRSLPLGVPVGLRSERLFARAVPGLLGRLVWSPSMWYSPRRSAPRIATLEDHELLLPY